MTSTKGTVYQNCWNLILISSSWTESTLLRHTCCWFIWTSSSRFDMWFIGRGISGNSGKVVCIRKCLRSLDPLWWKLHHYIAVNPLILFSSSVTMIKLQMYIYIYMKTSPAWCVPCQWRPRWRVSQASRSVHSLSTTCKQLPDTIRTVEVMHDRNCKLWILPDAWTAPLFALLWETAPVCVFTGSFSAGWLLLRVRVWTEASHQWLFTHCQGVVEPMLHICSHWAARSDKKQCSTSGRLTCKAPVWIYTSVNIFRMRHYTCNTCWPSGRGAVSFGVLHHLAAFWAPLRHSLMTAVTLSHMFSIGRLGLKVKAE